MNILIRSSSGITQVPVETKLLSERRIFIEGEITANTAMEFVKQMFISEH